MVEHRSERHAGSSINRVAAAEAALAEERQAREQLARQLREAETALREARTKLGHAELAHDELLAAIAVERNARAAAEEQVRQLSEKLQLQATEAPPEAPDLQDRRGRKPATTEAAPPAKRRGRPLGSISKNRRVAAKAPEPESDESQAVEWWVPGWQDRI